MGIDPFKKINELIIKCQPYNEITNLKDKIKHGLNDEIKYLIASEHIGIRVEVVLPHNINDIVKIIKENKIKGIYGYSSSILSLARYLYDNNIETLIVEGISTTI